MKTFRRPVSAVLRHGVGIVIVCAVLAGLAKLFSPTSTLEWERRTRIERCESSLGKLFASLDRYRSLNGHWPASLSDLVRDGLISEDGIQCPLADPNVIMSSRDYIYRFPSSNNVLSEPMVIDPVGCHHGAVRHVLFSNGRIERLSGEQAATIWKGDR